MDNKAKYLKYKKKYLELKFFKNYLDNFNQVTNKSLSANEFINQNGGNWNWPKWSWLPGAKYRKDKREFEEEIKKADAFVQEREREQARAQAERTQQQKNSYD